MNILITGGSGFLGRHLAAHLNDRFPHARLFTLSLTSSASQRDPAPGTALVCDMLDAEALRRAVDQAAPDWIFHLAGAARVSAALEMPDYFGSNFLTTAHLIRALENRRQPMALFFSSTVHVYGNQHQTVDETSSAAPVGHYGFTKYLAEEALRSAAARLPQLRVVTARLYSCIGPGQETGFVVPDLIGKLRAVGEGGVLRTGPLNGVRRFLDVRDAVALFPRLLEQASPQRYEIFNIASQQELSIEALVRKLIQISGRSVRIESASDTEPNPFLGLSIQVEKLNRTLGPAAFRPLEQTLRDMWTEGTAPLEIGRAGR